MNDTKPSLDRTELLLRTSRRGLMAVLAMMLLAGGTVIASAVWPVTFLANWPSKAPWLIPVAIALVVVLLNAPLGRRPWRADASEERAILEDEFRQTNLARAERIALLVVLAAQVPLGLLLLGLQRDAAVMAMAVSTITLGIATLITTFLIFDRG